MVRPEIEYCLRGYSPGATGGSARSWRPPRPWDAGSTGGGSTSGMICGRKLFPGPGWTLSFTLRQRRPEESLPWDHLESRVAKYFLAEERKRALEGVKTRDCRKASCNGCGVCYDASGILNRTADGAEAPEGIVSRPSADYVRRPPAPPPPLPIFQIRDGQILRAPGAFPVDDPGLPAGRDSPPLFPGFPSPAQNLFRSSPPRGP